MRIVHVLQHYMKTDGISVFLENVLREFCDQGHECWYVCEKDHSLSEGLDERINVVETNGSLDALGFVPDIVHVNALWSPFAARALRWCRRHDVQYVVSPHGCLMPRVMKKGWLKKHIFYWILLKKNLESAKAIHCTGEGEVAAVKVLGLQASTFVVPLGCHLPDGIEGKKEETRRTVLFLSRISEEKGLVHLLDAWKLLPHGDWRLVIAGPDWRGHLAVLQQKIRAEKIEGVEFPGAADAAMKDRLYRQADLFVLPSSMENFSMVVLDALAYGVPVICTKGTPWKVIWDNGCGWWIEPDSVDALVAALNDGMTRSHVSLMALSEKARDVAKDYSWVTVGESLMRQYSAIVGGCKSVNNDRLCAPR